MAEPRLFVYGDHWLVRRADTPNLYIYWCRPGTRRVLRRSTGTDDVDAAKQRLIAFADGRRRKAAMEMDAPAVAPMPVAAGHGPTVPPPSGPAVLEILAAYVDRLGEQRRVSHETALVALKHWTEFCESHDVVWVSELSLDTQEAYVRWRRSRLGGHIRSNATLNREFGVLRAALRDGWKRGRIASPPYIMSLPSPPPREGFLTEQESNRLLAACVDRVTRRFVLLMLHTLQRPKVIFTLRTNQVDLARNRIDFRPLDQAVTNKRYPVVPMTPTLRQEMEIAIRESVSGYVIERHGQPLKQMRKAFAAAVKAAGLRNVTPYVLRHTGATLAAAAGVPMRQIAGMLGHTSSRMTEMVYAKHQPEFLGQMASTLENLFGSNGEGLNTPCGNESSISAPVRAKRAPDVPRWADWRE